MAPYVVRLWGASVDPTTAEPIRTVKIPLLLVREYDTGSPLVNEAVIIARQSEPCLNVARLEGWGGADLLVLQSGHRSNVALDSTNPCVQFELVAHLSRAAMAGSNLTNNKAATSIAQFLGTPRVEPSLGSLGLQNLVDNSDEASNDFGNAQELHIHTPESNNGLLLFD